MNGASNAVNPIVLKVHEGTISGGESLCRTCRNGMLIRGFNGQHEVLCNGAGGQQPKRMVYDVARCNRYFNATQPTLYEMEEIAWRLVTKNAGRTIGFVDASEFQRMEQQRRNERPAE